MIYKKIHETNKKKTEKNQKFLEHEVSNNLIQLFCCVEAGNQNEIQKVGPIVALKFLQVLAVGSIIDLAAVFCCQSVAGWEEHTSSRKCQHQQSICYLFCRGVAREE